MSRGISHGVLHITSAQQSQKSEEASWPGLSPKARHVFKLFSISEEFVRKELKNIKPSKSHGLADIPTRLFKDGSGAIARPPTVLMNRSLAEDLIPPLHKSESS